MLADQLEVEVLAVMSRESGSSRLTINLEKKMELGPGVNALVRKLNRSCGIYRANGKCAYPDRLIWRDAFDAVAGINQIFDWVRCQLFPSNAWLSSDPPPSRTRPTANTAFAHSATKYQTLVET